MSLRGMKAKFAMLATWLAAAAGSSALTITIDYTDNSDPFFTAEAKNTLAKAAADVSFAITTTLSSLSQDVYTGVNGSTSASVNWDLRFTNPNDGTTTVNVPTFSFAQSEYVVKVGRRTIGGGTLGVGGAGGISRGISAGGFENQIVGAVDAMEALSNASMPRGGPLLGTTSGTITLGATNAAFVE